MATISRLIKWPEHAPCTENMRMNIKFYLENAKRPFGKYNKRGTVQITLH
jgi:hypothetical protein